MSSVIQTLPAEVVHLIAAGEVIDSIAAAVRELVENALDACATRINISVWPEAWRIRVADNGCGMDLADLRQAATPHSTSKISRCEDLWKITSLGFRGEALHSLAALADLEILSRTEAGEGWRVTYNSQGEPVHLETVAIAPGTVVTVSNLFGTWAVRRQGLPSLAQQMRAVQATIQQIALCHPHVTWQVHQNDRQWFTISSGKTAQTILPQLLRELRYNDLQQLNLEIPPPQTKAQQTKETNKKDVISYSQQSTVTSQHSPVNSHQSKIELVIGLPDRCHRHRPDWVKVALNGRMVKLSEIEQTIMISFARTLPRDRYPICFLHLQVSPEQIDWNRHPAKAEIYLHSLSYWQEKVSQAIEQALRISPATLSDSAHSQRLGQLLKVSEDKAGYIFNRSIQPLPADAESTKSEETGLIQLKAIAQVHNMYILAEHPAGMWLVEQHIAHERVLYEQLCNAWQLIPLEPPIILNNLSVSRVEQLQRIGLEIEPFGEQMWAIRTAPAPLAKRQDCTEALLELSLGGDLQTAQVATACRSAIRNGTYLTLPEMQTLLEQWQRTRNPRTCPHGRPIYLSLEESALSRFFRRHWVVGKSHGI